MFSRLLTSVCEFLTNVCFSVRRVELQVCRWLALVDRPQFLNTGKEDGSVRDDVRMFLLVKLLGRTLECHIQLINGEPSEGSSNEL